MGKVFQNHLKVFKRAHCEADHLTLFIITVELRGCQFTLQIEQHAFKNENNCLKTNIHSYLETSGGRSSNPYLNVQFFNTRVN